MRGFEPMELFYALAYKEDPRPELERLIANIVIKKFVFELANKELEANLVVLIARKLHLSVKEVYDFLDHIKQNKANRLRSLKSFYLKVEFLLESREGVK